MKLLPLPALLLTVLFALSGCNHTSVGVHMEFNVSELMPVGTRVELNKPLDIPAGEARVFFQRGKLIGDTPNFYYPHCELRVRKSDINTPYRVEPDTFVVTSIIRDEDPIVFLRYELGSPLRVASYEGGDPPDVFAFWKMAIHSEKQPEVRYLTCRGVQESPAWVEPPTLAEVKEALGPYFMIHYPKG